MAEKSIIISAEEEAILLKPIDEYVGKIQEQIDALRVEGSDKVNSLKNQIAIAKENKNLTKEEQNKIIGECKKNLEKAKATEDANKQQIAKLIADAEGFLSKHYNSEYYNIVAKSCEAEKKAENSNFEKLKADLQEEHKKAVSSLKDAEEIKAEKYTYKNKLYDAQMTHESRIQEIKDRKHDAYMHKFHLIDLLRMSKYTFAQKQAQNFENYKYTFNMTQFLYKNGLYIVIIMIFIALCIITPIVKNTQLFTTTNILNILQQASPRMFLALGVAEMKQNAHDSWENLKSSVVQTAQNLKESAVQAFHNMVSGIGNALSSLGSTVRNGFWSAISFITSLPSQAVQWGRDFIDGIVSGIRNAIGRVRDAVSDVASTIRSFLHFSVPDEGPLTEYESWMPDFMQGLAKGIEKSKSVVADAIEGVSKDMTINANAMMDQSNAKQTNAIMNITSLLAQYLPYLAKSLNIEWDTYRTL